MSMHAEDSAYALLSDGATIEIRVARPDDFDAVRDVHAKMSPDNLYLRFFSMSPLVAERRRAGYAASPGRTTRRCWPCWTARWSAAAPTSGPALARVGGGRVHGRR